MESNNNDHKEPNKINEPLIKYGTSQVKIFKSSKEQEEFEIKQMASLSSLEILQQLRKFINVAYGMHGYDPNNLPSKHTIKILTPRYK